LQVSFLPAAVLPFVCLLIALLTLFLFHRLFRVTTITLAFAAFGTPLLSCGMELSEHPFLLLASGLPGLYFFARAVENDSSRDAFLAGLFAVAGIWLRLEALLYALSLLGAWILITLRDRLLKQYAAFLCGVALIVVSFFVFNFVDYGHILGSRFLANEKQFYVGPLEKLAQVFTLVFFGKFKLGQFGFSPLLLWPVLFFVFARQKDKLVRILVLFVGSFLLVAGVAAPNDGIVAWGSRYLYLSLYPCLLLLDRFYISQIRDSTSLKKIPFYLLFSYSLLLGLVTFAIQKRVAMELKAVQTELQEASGDAVVFSSALVATYMGQFYFTKPTFFVESPESATRLVEEIKSRGPRTVSLIQYVGCTDPSAKRELEKETGEANAQAILKEFSVLKKLTERRLARIKIYEFVSK